MTKEAWQSIGSPQQNLIFQLPQAVIASLETDPLTTRIDYQVYREFVVSVSGGSTEVTLTTTSANETFVANLNQTTITVADLPGDQSRQAAIGEAFFEDGIIDELSEFFQIRTFRFDGQTQRINGMEGLSEEGTASSVDQALQYVDDQLN